MKQPQNAFPGQPLEIVFLLPDCLRCDDRFVPPYRSGRLVCLEMGRFGTPFSELTLKRA